MFRHQTLSLTFSILNAYDFFLEIDISILTKRYLIKIEQHDKLWMQELLRDMGRYIVHKRSQKKHGMQSHLWSYRKIGNLLKTHKVAVDWLRFTAWRTPILSNTKTWKTATISQLLKSFYFRKIINVMRKLPLSFQGGRFLTGSAIRDTSSLSICQLISYR